MPSSTTTTVRPSKEGGAELSNDDDVEGRIKSPSDLEGHRDAASWQTEDDHVLTP
jgi:hypothetical protein